MRAPLLVLALLTTALLAGCSQEASPAATGFRDGNGDGLVVVALVDAQIDPYHWDFLAEYLPQHLNDDPTDDVPLGLDPSSWLEGFPDPAEAFASYTALDLNLTPDDGSRLAQELHDGDQAQWDLLHASTAMSVHYTYIPGTKIVGLVDFSGDGAFAPDSHGMGVASVSVGNLHGACPECLLVFLNGLGNAGDDWANTQPWIDVVSNSWGTGLPVPCTPPGLPVQRCERADVPLSTGSDLELRRNATERGQATFWAAGNGLRNDFQVPMPTYLGDYGGNDWTIVVGAVSPEGYSYTGHFKPVHVASLGNDYPRGAGPTVAGEGKFSGTSNASPVVAGMYAKALHELRQAMGSPRIQEAGVIAVGQPGCAAANPHCALEDGVLTVHELRQALFRSANYTFEGNRFGSILDLPDSPVREQRAELTYLSEGHGTLWGRYHGTGAWQGEFGRIVGFASGTWFSVQDGNQVAWFQVDSMCRQAIWGSWDFGYYLEGTTTLPAPSQDWPIRTAILEGCPAAAPAVRRDPSPLA